ncbi:MAG: phosphate acyltransferase [Gammaproteobacteria bacterium]|nr:phosphate acyltransferase [Gammaproteobacteria bacterium]
MADLCRIGIDTLGSETPTSEIVQGALDFARGHEECQLVFVGREDELRCVREFGHSVVPCEESISQYESLIGILRHKRNSSMKVGLQLVAASKIDAVVSTGDTGALMALSRQVIPMLPQFDRPSIIKRFDGKRGPVWMLDLGANIIRKLSLLVQFAQMGSAYAKAIGRLERPRISLLNIGSEARKGPQVLREVASMLSRTASLNFVGYTEADQLFDGTTDVVVADGFSGNVALKSIEGAIGISHYFIEGELRAAGLDDSELAISVAQRVRDKLSAQAYNGASLIGLNGIVVKSHGRTDRVGIGSALRLAKEEIKAGVPSFLKSFQFS